MKNILPFKGILYNQDKIDSMSNVVTPPYDVISSEMQNELYDRSEYNFCRVDLTKETGNARYEVAKKVFLDWQDQQVFVQENKPAIYIHHHSFTLSDGSKVTRKGFFAGRKIEDFSEGGIKPHEKTLDGPKIDRLNMTRATKVNLSPVFSLYSDPDNNIQKKLARLVQTTPSIDFMSKDGERHEVWKLTDPEICDYIDAELADKPLFIADGHHRYETALNFRNETIETQGELPKDSAVRYLLMYFSNLNDPGMVVLPIHRALYGLKNISLKDTLDKLSSFFEVQKITATQVDNCTQELSILANDHHAFMLLTKDPDHSYILSLKREKWLSSEWAKEVPACLANLDVTVLHHYIFGKVFGLSEESQANQENIIYWKSTQKAITETKNGKCDMTFILNPTRIDDIQSVALKGYKMPQKSTFFYPKIVSGLVLHSVDFNEKDGLS